MAITITDEFQDALSRINAGSNVLISGKAGTGKSTLLRTFLDSVEEKNVLVTAPTGVAALNVGGFTIHKAFGFRPGMYPDDLKSGGKYHASSATAKLLQTVEILVVDEISMVRADLFDMINLALQRLRKDTRPFGGVQLVLVGDLLQLPPVVTDDESRLFTEHWDSPYFFSAHCYDEVALSNINLTTVWRQSDEEFIEILNQVREGSVSDAALDRLNKQVDKDFQAPDDWVTVSSRRKGVDKINRERLEALESEKFLSVAVRSGDTDRTSFSGSDELHYAVGARVMTVINDPLERFVNGSFGTILKAEKDTITVQLDHNDEVVELSHHVWEIKRPTVTDTGIGSEIIGSVTQFPVILAWAITIHKSQGKTIPKLFINLAGGTATDGQFYVALSRGVSLDNLRLSAPVEPRHIRANNSLVRRIRRDVGPLATTNRITFLSIDGVNFGISDHVARIHAVVMEGSQKVADFGTWINPMSDLGSFGERHRIPAGGLAMAPTLSDFWPLLLRQAEGSIVVGDNLPMLERAIRHQEKGMDLALGNGYDFSEFSIPLSGSDVIERSHAMAAAHSENPLSIGHGQVVPLAPQHTEGAVFIPSWAPQSPMLLDPTHATDSDHAWAAYSGGPANDLVADEVVETADLLSAWAVSRGYWTESEEDDVRTRAAHAGVVNLILPDVESLKLDVSSLLIPGTRIAFTGRNNLLGGPADDDRLRELCAAKDLEYKTSVSKTRCDVLVAHDPASQSRKAQNAREYGKPIISQDDFEDWYNNGADENASTVSESEATPAAANISPAHEASSLPEPEPEAPQAPEDTFEYTWVSPEEYLAPGTRVSFRGSTYVDGVLLPQGEPLHGLCSMLGIEYKQAVTKTRCDVLVTDAQDAVDGKMKMARMHNKPLIRQEDFDAWAKQKLAELDFDDARDAGSEEQEDELIVEAVEPAPLETPAPAVTPVAAAGPVQPDSDTNWVSYQEYVASSAQAPVASAPAMPAAPTYAVTSSAGTVAERPKFEKALKRTKQSAIVAVVLFVAIIVAGLAGLPAAVGGISLLGSMAAAISTVFFGIKAIVHKVQGS
ncbi:AAA family ATPase [Corynebacterium casei]|uniref:AAA family ATPase n=1 Tax=Corynebacterium casei TaxID=160386 RepID=UPI003FD58855